MGEGGRRREREGKREREGIREGERDNYNITVKITIRSETLK